MEFKTKEECLLNISTGYGRFDSSCFDGWRSDPEVALAAVEKRFSNWKFVGRELLDNKSVVLAALRITSTCLWDVSDRLKNDMDVARLIVETEPSMFKELGEIPRENKELLLQVYRKNPGGVVNNFKAYAAPGLRKLVGNRVFDLEQILLEEIHAETAGKQMAAISNKLLSVKAKSNVEKKKKI